MMSSRNKKTTNFTSMANAMMNDPSLRALKNKDVFEETVKMFQLGLISWNYSGIVGFLQTAQSSASIEKVKTLHAKADNMTNIVSVTPNIISNGGSNDE